MVTHYPFNEVQGEDLVGLIGRQNIILSEIADNIGAATPATLREIHSIVQSGRAPKVFNIGDQLLLNYNDGSRDYILPFDVVHFGNVTLKSGNVVPGMFIQSHYAMQACQFDNYEAFYVAPEGGLEVGTYHFTTGNSWSKIPADTSYQFTLESIAPAGSLLCIEGGWPDKEPNTWKVTVYVDGKTFTAAQTLNITEGSEGTDLGTISSSIKYGITGLNNMQRVGYGYNRWGQSGIRQWLNSSAAANAWWTSQNPYDRAPTQLANMRGFMAGFDEEFLNIIKPIKVTTALNTVSDSEIGTLEDTFDTFFPAALEQEYVAPQLAGEGDYWEYWKQRLGINTPAAQYSTMPEHIRYAYDNQSSAQLCRLRSASRGSAYHAWYVGASGLVGGIGAGSAYRCAPACVIC